jgi:dienelactone hydrolase
MIEERLEIPTLGAEVNLYRPDRLEAALRDWHGAFESEVYQGAAHGWTVPGRDGVYNELQAQRAFEKEVELFDATLKA